MARAERLEQILEAGARALGERGVHGASMRDVAAEASLSLGTVYHHVAGREDLVYQVERRILEAAVASARAALAARGGARDRLRALLTDHVRRVAAHPIEAATIAGEHGTRRGERGRRIEALRHAYLDLAGTTVESALRRGASRGRETETRTLMLLGMADRLTLDALQRRVTPQPGRIASRVLAVFLEGARARR